MLRARVSSFGFKYHWSRLDLAIEPTVLLRAMGTLLDVVPTEKFVSDQRTIIRRHQRIIRLRLRPRHHQQRLHSVSL